MLVVFGLILGSSKKGNPKKPQDLDQVKGFLIIPRGVYAIRSVRSTT